MKRPSSVTSDTSCQASVCSEVTWDGERVKNPPSSVLLRTNKVTVMKGLPATPRVQCFFFFFKWITQIHKDLEQGRADNGHVPHLAHLLFSLGLLSQESFHILKNSWGKNHRRIIFPDTWKFHAIPITSVLKVSLEPSPARSCMDLLWLLLCDCGGVESLI